MKELLEMIEEAIHDWNEQRSQDGEFVRSIRDLQEAGYLTNNQGFEIRLEDGKTFIITVQEK